MQRLFILHGWGQNKTLWDNFTNQFHDIPVVALDLPGFGAEPLVDKNWSIPEYAKWVTSKIESLVSKDDQVILLGHSFGGRIASFIASEQPSWLHALILYAAPSIYRPSAKTKTKIVLAKLLKSVGLKLPANNNPELQEADRSGLGNIFRNVVNFDQTNLLPKISVSTLLVWGENDTEVPVTIAKEMSLLIPHSKLVIIDKADHNIHINNPTIFYGTIKHFIENL